MINKFLKATKFCTLCFLFLLSSFHNNLLAQTDTLFYVPPILDWGAGTATNRIQLEMLFSTNFPRAVVRIRTPSNSFSATVTVLSGITTNYVMPENTNLFDGTSRSTVGSYDRLLPFAVRNDIGIIIQSDFPVSVIQKLNDHTSNLSLNNNEELIILKGSNGLGTQFRAGSQTVVDGAGSWTSDDKQFIGVMASQNGTLVTISGPTNFVGVTLPAVVNMNAGESFVMGTTNSYDIVAGTRIFSNKPVSVTTGSQHTRIAPGLAGDAGIDNLVPYNLLGTQYIAVNGGGSNPYDYVVVVPTQDNTIVRVDGVIVDADLDEAENYMRFSFPTSVLGVGRPHSIETSSPAYVFHIASRATNNEVGMSLLPQLNCTGSKQIGFQIDNILSNIINFVVPTSALSSFRLNNQSTTALGVTIRTVTGLSNWSAFNVNIASGAAVVDYDAIASEKFHVGILGANGGTGLYGYISGFDQRFTLFDIFNTTLPTTGFSSLGGYCPNTAISNKLTLGSCGQFHSITGFTTKFGSNITTSLIGINKVDFSINPPTSTFIGCDTIKYIVKNDLGQTDSVTVEACWGPTKVAAGIDFGTCGSSTRLPAEFMRFGVGRWSQVSGPNTASISNVLDRNATVTGLVDGVYNFRWTGSLSGCNVVSDDVLLGVTCAPVYPINADTDGDGIPNDIDLDDDNDGITDVVEYCGINGFTNGNPELITNGNFSVLASGIFPLAANTNWAGWRSSVPYHGNNIYPPDTRVAIQSGNINYVGGIVTQVTFPGDAFFGVPPSSTYLYANGNTTAGAYLLCSQTITGVSPASVYEITSYVSNGVDPTGSSPNDPLLYYFIGNTSVTGSFKQVYDHSDPLSGHGGVDRWDRWTSNYTTGPSQTVLGFSIRDFQIGSNRDEFAITRISIKKQGYGCLDADPLQDSDFDGVQNYRDSDYCLAIGSSINIKGVCASLDFDTDGIINSIDLDSDNDGIYDLFEAGHNATDANNDGKVDGAVGTNGFLNTLEASDATTLGIAMTYTLLNSDSVSGVDFLDLDSDNDGCFDAREAGFLDQNNDGNLGNIPLTVSTISGTVTSGIGYTRPATITGLTYYYRTATSGIGCTPETTIDGFLALEDVSSITGSVLTNDYNPLTNGTTALSITGFNGTITGGTLSLTGTGNFIFVPNLNYNGITSYTYTICNIQACTTANLVFTIIGVNDAPFVSITPNTISGIAGTTNSGTITGFGDVDNPLSQLTVSGLNPISSGPNGTVNTITGGTVTISGTGAVIFQGTIPGIHTLNYQVCDPTVTCTSAVLTISISGAVPIPTNDGFSTNENTSISGNLLTNDFNPNTNASVTGLTLNTSPTLLGANIGTLSVNGAGGFTFVPSAELAQGVTTVTTYRYQVCNNIGCSTAQAVFSVTGVNDPPIATNINTSTTSNTSITGTLLFTDPDGIVTVTSQNLTNTSGTFTVSTTGGYSFIPNGTFTGISQFTVSGCDLFTCTSAIVTVTVLQNTLNPIANSDINNVLESGTITGNILTNDINPITGLNTQLTVTGIVVQSPIGNVIITNSLTGAYTFIPNANVELAQGVTTITSAIYQVCNVNGCSTAQISFTITGVNDAPIATNLSTSTTSNTSITGTVPFTDPDGLVTVTSQNITNPTGTFNVNTTGGYSFIPNGTFTGITSFTVNGCDLFTCTSAIVTVTVLQNTLNPKAVNDINTVLESGTTTGNILTNDINPITGLNTQLTVTGIVVQSPLGNVIITNSLTGAYTFIPNANVELAAGVTTTTSAIYNVCNVNGCSTAQISFTITGVNDAPIATNVNTSTTSNTSISGTVPFTDPDGIVTVTSQNLTNTSGTFTVSTTDGYSFIPNGTFTGITSFTVNGCDLFTCTSAIVTVTVLQNTLNPKVVNDINTVLESGTTTGNILTNDINPITGLNTQLTVTGIVVQSPLGNVIITNSLTGAYTFIPNANVELAAGVTTTTSAIYNVCNVNGCSTAQISFTITGVNDAPIATNVNTSTTSNTSISGTVVFTDPDGAVTVTSQNVTNPTGTFTVSTAGGYTFIPNGTFTGISQFTVSGCDLFTCTSAIVTVTVLQNTLNPIANSDINNVLESGTITGNVLTNDINPITGLNTQLTVTGIVVQSPIGNVIITNSLTGAYTFIPNANVELAAGITTTTSAIYQVCNVNGCSTAQIAITITGVNDAPIAISLTETTNEDVPLNATISGFADADNLISELTVSTVSSGLPSNGTLILNPNGTYTYTPNPNFNGNDTFTYQVCDLNTCTSATVNITINSQNDRPIALNTTFSGFEETTISGVLVNNSLTGNYYDLDGDLLSINSISGFATSNGIVSISNNGTFIYIPNSNFSGIDIYTYQVCDASNLCAQAQIIFSITGLNDAPIFPATTISGIEDVPLIGNISGVLDPENDTMTITGISTSPNGILTVLPNGDYTFTGTNNFSGTIPFTITICDPFTCTSSVVTVIISPINDAPIANNITVIATEDALSVSGTISGINTSNSNNDVFDIDNTTLTITPIPATATTNGTIQLNGNGTYSFTVNSGLILPVGQILTESIPYEVCDLVTCTSANLLITIVGVNDAPVAQNRISATDPSQLVTIQGIATDSDNDVLTYSIINVIVNSSVTGTPIYSINSTTGLVSYTPSSDISIHIDYVIYAACDPSGVCRTAQMAISVPASQFPPNSISANSTFNEDAPSEVINVNSLVSDPNGDAITITGIIPIPSNQGTISLVNGVLTFVPALNFNGTITLTFTGCEVANLTSCTSNVIIINILPINDAPVIANKTKTGNEDSTITGNLLNTPTDNDPDGTILNINTTPISGPSFGNITINADGTYIYVPNSNFKGIDVVTVQICDNGTPLPKICNEIVLSITVNGINDAPIAPLVTIIGNEDMVINHTLTGISDPDAGDILTITTVNGAATANGGTITISGNGVVSYTPAPDFTGNDTYSYEVCDNGTPAICVQSSITIIVAPVNDAPIARDDIYSFNPNQTVSGLIKMKTNDSDPDGNSFVYSVLKHTSSIPANKGIITSLYTTLGEIDYFTGLNSTPRTDTVFYQICDNGVPSKCDSAKLIIVIPASPLLPQVLNENATTPEDVVVNIQIANNDYDPNGETISHTITSQPKNGIAVLNTATGIVTYTPNQNYFGKDTLTYSVCDPTITCTSGFVYVNITPVNDAPIALPLVVNTSFNTPISSTISGYSDVDNVNISVNPFGGTIIGGSLTVNANGTFTFTPNATFTGSTVFNYQVCDPTITCTSSTLTINVSSSTSPILLSDDIQTIEDVSITGNVFTNDTNPLTGNNTGLTITGFINNGNNIGILSINSLTGIYNFVPNVELPQGITTTTSYFYTACYANECSTAQIAITVTGLNDAPIGTNVNTLTTSNTSITGTVPFSDPDGNVTITSQNLTNTSGTFTVSTTGGYTFIPNGTFTGIVSFTIVGCDLFTCTSAVITIDVQNPISTLQVRDDLISTNENTSITGNILSNDLNPITGDNSQITLSGITNILDNIGIFTINSVTGFYSFVPTIELAQGIVTITSAKYTACNLNECLIGQILITVIGVNDAPLVTVNSPINGGNLTGTIPGFITLDPDGDVLTITAVGGIENVGTLTILPNGTYTFIPNPNSTVSGLVPFNITVCDIYTCTSAVIFINIPAKATTEEEVKIPNGFSPNGDGINDDFVIVKPNNSPKVTLKVFNRWGNFVYEKDDYDNTWNGSSNKGIVVGNGGNGLPDGTYYIIVDFNNGSEKTIKYITISR